MIYVRSTQPKATARFLAVRSRLATSLAAVAVLATSAFLTAAAQEKTQRDSTLPLVYTAENSGARYPAPTFPSFAQLPILRPLPDPFLFANGLRDTNFTAWEVRRNEISAAIQNYEIGPKPDCHDCTITANYVPPAASASPAVGTLTVNITRNGKTMTMTSSVTLPTGQGNGPYPALIPMELTSFTFGTTVYNFPAPTPDYGSLPASVFQGTPVATVGFPLAQVASYSFSAPSVHTADPFYTLYPELCAGICTSNNATVTSNSGEYAAWSWGVSRLIDGMEIASHQSVNPLPIDMTHLAVTGCSYAGKMALFAGAFDERIALTIAQENGGGGAPSWRVSHEIEAQGAVEDIDDTSYDWFAGQMHQFAGANVYKLPEDHHELMAMVAPRALLQTGNTDFYWLSNRSNYVSSRATQQIYNQFGIGDRFGFYIDGGHAHCATLPAEAPAISAFVSKFMLAQTSTNTDIEVTPFPTLDAARWTWWWNKQSPNDDPQFPNNWVSAGNAIVSLDTGLGFLQFNAGQPVQAGYQVRIPGDHPAASVTLTGGGNVEADVRCSDASTYTLTIPFPANQTYAVGANKTAWTPAAGTYQGVAPATACPSGVTSGVLVNAYFSALGVNNGVGNPPKSPGITTTDTADPVQLRFNCSANGQSTGWSTPVNVNPQPNVLPQP